MNKTGRIREECSSKTPEANKIFLVSSLHENIVYNWCDLEQHNQVVEEVRWQQ